MALRVREPTQEAGRSAHVSTQSLFTSLGGLRGQPVFRGFLSSCQTEGSLTSTPWSVTWSLDLPSPEKARVFLSRQHSRGALGPHQLPVWLLVPTEQVPQQPRALAKSKRPVVVTALMCPPPQSSFGPSMPLTRPPSSQPGFTQLSGTYAKVTSIMRTPSPASQETPGLPRLHPRYPRAGRRWLSARPGQKPGVSENPSHHGSLLSAEPAGAHSSVTAAEA